MGKKQAKIFPQEFAPINPKPSPHKLSFKKSLTKNYNTFALDPIIIQMKCNQPLHNPRLKVYILNILNFAYLPIDEDQIVAAEKLTCLETSRKDRFNLTKLKGKTLLKEEKEY